MRPMRLINMAVLMFIALVVMVGWSSSVIPVKATEISTTAYEHFIKPTFPVDPEFAEASPNGEDEYSWSHCFSSSMQTYAWRSNACFLQNLCFNLTSKELLFYAAKENHAPDNVSIGTFNMKWGTQYDKTVNFRPKIIVGKPIPKHRLMASKNELWIPFLPFCPANIGHLIWDDYLTLYLLSWAAKPVLFDIPDDFSLRPLWYNPPDDPPWATCDWIRLHEGPGHSLKANYSDRCMKNNDRWLPLLIGEGNHVLPETSKFDTQRSPTQDLVCFPRAAYGVTPFANQGSGHHGWHPKEGLAPAFGRAPLMFGFTRHMMRHIQASDLPAKSLKDIIIFFSSKSSHRVNVDFTAHAKEIEEQVPSLELAVARLVGHNRLRIKVIHEVLYLKTALDQVNLAASACVYVTAAGGGAFTAQFLPRGSSIILYHEAEGDHMHQGRVDWKVFNSASWMRSTYVDIHERKNTTKLKTMIVEEVMNCVAFMEALDV